MKKLLALAIFTLGVIGCTEIDESVVTISSPTTIQIFNKSNDTVLVYLTLGATPGCIQDVNLIPFIQDSIKGSRNLQGTFLLMPNDSTISYSPDSLGFNGVISFHYAPDNCPSPSYTNGINQFEFIINNGFVAGYPQETIDISCVHGVNCVIRVNVSDSNWTGGPHAPLVQSFANTMNKSQTGMAGVYPYGCDICVASKAPPACIPLPQPTQKHNICNIQRSAKLNGGTIKVLYLGRVDILK